MDYNDELFLAAVGDATRIARRSERVVCSCGRTTRMELDGEKYVPWNPLWKFRKTDEREPQTGRRLAWGWYCGEEGHEERAVEGQI